MKIKTVALAAFAVAGLLTGAQASAQEKLTEAKIKADKVNNFKLPPLQEEKTNVKKGSKAPTVDPKAVAWAKRNPWFHTDEEMTGFAFGLHNKLVSSGVDPKSDIS